MGGQRIFQKKWNLTRPNVRTLSDNKLASVLGHLAKFDIVFMSGFLAFRFFRVVAERMLVAADS